MRAVRKLRSSLLLGVAAMLLAGCSTLPGWVVLQGNASITDYRHFHNVEAAPSPTPMPLPPAPEPAKLPQVHQGESFEQLLERNGTVAFIVLKDGRVAYERYFDDYRRDSLTTSFSVAKSVVALLLGAMIDEGRIGSVDDPLTRYLPELAQRDARFSQVTLKHLLEMRSGIEFHEEYHTPWSQAARFYLSPDLHAEAMKLSIEAPPDTRRHYSSGDTQLLGMAIERAAGQPLARVLQQRLWQPMGAEYAASWSQDSAEGGVTKAFCCLNARAIDFARLGQLVLQRGRVGDRQVLPAGWIDDMLKVREHPGEGQALRDNIELYGTPEAAFYIWQWRRVALPDPAAPGHFTPSDDSFAEGLYGQFVYVAPKQRVVIVRMGSRSGAGPWWPALMARIAAMNG
jgi:CubicO group peptidase (beta-lactamase class C family)